MKKIVKPNTKTSAELKRLRLLKIIEKMEKNSKSMKVKTDSASIIRKYRNMR